MSDRVSLLVHNGGNLFQIGQVFVRLLIFFKFEDFIPNLWTDGTTFEISRFWIGKQNTKGESEFDPHGSFWFQIQVLFQKFFLNIEKHSESSCDSLGVNRPRLSSAQSWWRHRSVYIYRRTLRTWTHNNNNNNANNKHAYAGATDSFTHLNQSTQIILHIWRLEPFVKC